MVATKNKVTLKEQVIEDIKAKYGSGEATQSELASSFSLSVSQINKLVKGVRPEKRKYRRSEEKQARNATIVEEYNSGVAVKDIADKYKMSYQNVSLILKQAGLHPQEAYVSKLKEQGAARKLREAEAKKLKQSEKQEAVVKLSELWKSGATIEEFRAAAGLKTVNSAQVKLVLLRKSHGEEMFPRRNRRKVEEAVEAVQAPEAVEEVEAQETQEEVVEEFVAENE